MQWKAPTSTSAWVQRAGQAARAPGCEGLAVLLVEKAAFETNPTAPCPENPVTAQLSQRGRGRG